MPTFGAGSSCRAAGQGRDEAGSSGAGSGARPGSRPYGWGQKGHRIVADIAQERLTEVTKRNVQSLIGNNTLASVANWTDQIRPERDETYNWHFVDIPKDAQGFSDPRGCYRPEDTHKGAKDDHQNCVVDRIEYFKRVLGDKSASRDDRIEVLKFIVHFVGDIHQPFHAIGEAKGGNGIPITEFGSDRHGRYPCNLHSAWDSGLIEHTGMDEQAYVAHLDQLISQERLHSSGNPPTGQTSLSRWRRRLWVNDGGSVDEQYYQQQIKVVDERLAKKQALFGSVLSVVGRWWYELSSSGRMATDKIGAAVYESDTASRPVEPPERRTAQAASLVSEPEAQKVALPEPQTAPAQQLQITAVPQSPEMPPGQTAQRRQQLNLNLQS